MTEHFYTTDLINSYKMVDDLVLGNKLRLHDLFNAKKASSSSSFIRGKGDDFY